MSGDRDSHPRPPPRLSLGSGRSFLIISAAFPHPSSCGEAAPSGPPGNGHWHRRPPWAAQTPAPASFQQQTEVGKPWASCGVVPASHPRHLRRDVGGSGDRTARAAAEVVCGGGRLGQPSGGRGQAVPSDPAAPGAPRGELGASPAWPCLWVDIRRGASVGAGRRKPLHRRKPRVNPLRAAPLRGAQNSPPPTRSFFSILFFFPALPIVGTFPFLSGVGIYPNRRQVLGTFWRR